MNHYLQPHKQGVKWGSSLSLLAMIALTSSKLAAATTGLHAEYIFQNPGSKPPVVERIDQTISYSFNSGVSPVSGYPSTYYSAVWSGSITAPASGTYTFYVTADDNARLWVDKEWIAERLSYNGGSAKTVQGTVTLTAGVQTPILLRFWQLGGRADAKLEWSGPGIAQQVVPASVLSPSGWTHIEAPASTYESPASVIIHHRYSAAPQISTDPPSNLVGPATSVGATAVWADVNLVPNTTVSISAIAGDQSANAGISWTPVDFASPPTQINIRCGSSILVKPRDGGIPCVSQGYDRTRTSATPSNGLYSIPFTTAGTYTVDDNLAGNAVTIKVIQFKTFSGIEPGIETKNLMIPVDTNWVTRIPTIPLDVGTILTSCTYEHNVFVVPGTATDTNSAAAGIRIYSAGIQSYGCVRIEESGSILARANLMGVNLTTSAAVIDTTNPDGSRVGHAFAYMFPFTNNLEYTISMRAHKATFAGGKTSFSAKTDGSPTSLGEPGFTAVTLKNGSVIGRLQYTVLFPAGETKWCFTAMPAQVAP